MFPKIGRPGGPGIGSVMIDRERGNGTEEKRNLIFKV
jgi:hypothetical protein